MFYFLGPKCISGLSLQGGRWSKGFSSLALRLASIGRILIQEVSVNTNTSFMAMCGSMILMIHFQKKNQKLSILSSRFHHSSTHTFSILIRTLLTIQFLLFLFSLLMHKLKFRWLDICLITVLPKRNTGRSAPDAASEV